MRDLSKVTLKAHMGEGTAPVVRLPENESTVQFTIDDHQLSVPDGTTILSAALFNGIDIPHFCYHPGLSPEGNCRMCLVEIEGRPKLEPSCILPVMEGQVILSRSEAVLEARNAVMEFLLLNHPLDCPWCDKAGECMLQDNSFEHGSGITRHRLEKVTFPDKDFSARLKMYSNRCIKCTRCVRFLADIEGGEEFAVFERGVHADVGTYINHNLTNEYQGCLADVCPVGALVLKPFLYLARAFYLESTPSVCPLCSRGCSIYIDRYENRVVRIRPRPNLDVNDWWICDRGRFKTGWTEVDRLEEPAAGSEGSLRSLDWDSALEAASYALKNTEKGHLAGLIWAGATCEELYLFCELIKALDGSLFSWYGPEGRVDPAGEIDFLRRRDLNSNSRGLEAIAPAALEVPRLLERIGRGEVKTLLVLASRLDGETAGKLQGVDNLVVISSHRSTVTERATVALPGSVWTEKSGTFLNGDGHLQRFSQAVDGLPSARPELEIISDLIRRCNLGEHPHSPEAVFEEMSRTSGPCKGIAWREIPPTGLKPEGLKLDSEKHGGQKQGGER